MAGDTGRIQALREARAQVCCRFWGCFCGCQGAPCSHGHKVHSSELSPAACKDDSMLVEAP